MANSNCLEGVRCPKCGSEEPFRVRAESLFTLYDDGVEGYEDVEWNDDSCMSCVECGHEGTASEFQGGRVERRAG